MLNKMIFVNKNNSCECEKNTLTKGSTLRIIVKCGYDSGNCSVRGSAIFRAGFHFSNGVRLRRDSFNSHSKRFVDVNLSAHLALQVRYHVSSFMVV